MLPENRAFLVRGDDGQEYGPVDLAELREWVRENRAGIGTTVCLDEPNATWQPWQDYPELVALVAEIQGTAVAFSPPGTVIAGMGKRLLSCILDFILCNFLASPILSVVMIFFLPNWENILMQVLLQPENPVPPEFTQYARIGNIIVYGMLAFYMAGFIAMHGQTPAKSLLRLRVVDKNGQKPTFTKSLLRGIVYAISFYFCGIPFLYAFFNPQRRAPHDLLAGTYVVNA